MHLTDVQVLGAVLGANHDELSRAIAQRLKHGQQNRSFVVEGVLDRSKRLSTTPEQLLDVVLGSEPDHLAAAIAERLKRGQECHEEFWQLQCKLTDDQMTRDSYTLNDLLGFLEDRRAEGHACGLCKSLLFEERDRSCEPCRTAVVNYHRDEPGSYDEMERIHKEHPNHVQEAPARAPGSVLA